MIHSKNKTLCIYKENNHSLYTDFKIAIKYIVKGKKARNRTGRWYAIVYVNKRGTRIYIFIIVYA